VTNKANTRSSTRQPNPKEKEVNHVNDNETRPNARTEGAPVISLDDQRALKSPRLYRIDEVVASLGLGRTVVFDLLRTGELRSVTIGRSRRVPADWLDEFIETLKARAGDAA
jgi:excisionase family DNA binding protein